MSWLTSAPIVACVPKNPGCFNQSIERLPRSFNSLDHSRPFYFTDCNESRLGHPLHCLRCGVTGPFLSIHEDVHRECRGPGGARSSFVDKPVFDDQSTVGSQMVIDFFDQGLVRAKGLVMEDVGHQHEIVRPSEAIAIEIPCA